jgi:hypothetical protein
MRAHRVRGPVLGHWLALLPLLFLPLCPRLRSQLCRDDPPRPEQPENATENQKASDSGEDRQPSSPAEKPSLATGGESTATGEPSAPSAEEGSAAVASTSPIDWLTDYGDARNTAEAEGKMLLIFFCDPDGSGPCAHCDRFERETLRDPAVCEKLRAYVRVRLPLETRIKVDEKEIALVDHAAFAAMRRQPGIAVLDFMHKDLEHYGCLVSAFPITGRLWYTPAQMAVILDLPTGSLTQRTLIYAVRVHPEQPASTQGEADPYLLSEAESHAQYQAAIRLQGHHRWETRFHRINACLPCGLTAVEVCAESWPGENLVEAAVECVRCWRTSSGHWSAVRAPHRLFGYDMKCGANGVWYATGIFGKN